MPPIFSIIKPDSMALEHRVVTWSKRRQLSIGMFGFFALDVPGTLLSESALRRLWLDVCGSRGVALDSGRPFQGNENQREYDSRADKSTEAPFRTLPCIPGKEGLAERLPAIRARCFVQVQNSHSSVIRKLDAECELVKIFPRHNRAVVLHRALLPLGPNDNERIVRVVADWEALDAPALPIECYLDRFDDPLTEASLTSGPDSHHAS